MMLFFFQAKFFTESRLLQREVKVVLESMSYFKKETKVVYNFMHVQMPTSYQGFGLSDNQTSDLAT